MTDELDFDVIVVGAGVAGSVAAYQLARAGHTVALIERGDSPGSKNLSGGLLYTHSLLPVFPDLLGQAPVERTITRNHVQFLNQSSAVGLDYQDSRLAGNAVSVLRAKFDPWLAEQAEQAGAMVMPGVRVDRVLKDASGAVVGIAAGEDELHARVVVAADGVNSFIAREAGLRHKEPPKHFAVGVKSVIALDRSILEQRFNLQGNDGAAWAIVGDCTQGVAGGAFLYTNLESISVGVVLRLDDLTRKHKVASDVHDHFLAHPLIAPLLDGGEAIEYGCHLVAEGGLGMVGDVAMDGMVVVGDAAGLTLNTGLTLRGMDLAAQSAIDAAAAIGDALTSGDTSKAGLAGYPQRLFAGFAGRDMTTYAKAPKFFERNRVYGEYGNLVGDILFDVFRHDRTPRRHLLAVARHRLKSSPVTLRQVVGDGLAGVRAL